MAVARSINNLLDVATSDDLAALCSALDTVICIDYRI